MSAEGAPDEREKAEKWIKDRLPGSGWNVGRFLQFIEDENYLDVLAETLAIYAAYRAGATPAESRGAAQPDLEAIALKIEQARETHRKSPAVNSWYCKELQCQVCATFEFCLTAMREALQLAQPDLEAIALKYFPYSTSAHGSVNRQQCLAAMREALQLPSREKEQK